MGITSNFLKLRSNGTPKTGEWNKNYDKALSLAKKNGKFIIACWSNGDACCLCTNTETCMMDKVFTKWMETSDAYFVFQYSGDSDKGQTVQDWIYKGTGLKPFPGFRITYYNEKGKIVVDKIVDGTTLRNKKTKTDGAKAMVAAIKKVLAKKPSEEQPPSDPTPSTDYKVRLNEELTVKKVNAVLDAIDKNDGYCPCQPKGAGTKCHCDDFVKVKKIGEPCICNIYVKQKR